ncbi:PIG-L family deacetylase [Dyadobacter sp. CY356]|uniref:PIG-L family deacetylase n=1 Tax=Dyadobacter sp. CY356 TaxID=2906442 RepID=UPI001F21F6DC|nr:PIG-L family deacetylase [Dyadobacter sp. CY356]MCF0056303.1 PIG-L family deacetylase [Dyadobacter sp. CY356]
MKKLLLIGFLLIKIMTPIQLHAQHLYKPSSSKILQSIQKLNVLGNVLYFGAHPDDENPTLIAYMANEKLYNTAYFSLTRGDGGQNMIGSEMKENLGILRTQELLQARKIDGGQQFFSRAVDFGFSKSAEEVFTIWDKEKLLADAVWVIRKFKPDLIISRFPPDERAGHGQHIASAILIEEAFEAAADPAKFPEQLQYVQVWKAKRLVWNAGMWWNQRRDEVDEKEAEDYIKLDVGSFNPLLGKSYGEIAAESRSLHRSQGFGTVGFRGTLTEYFKHVKGDKAGHDLMEGVSTNWTRVKDAQRITKLILEAEDSFKLTNPSLVVPQLLTIKKEIEKLPDSYWKQTKLQDLDKVIQDALGLFIQITATDNSYTPGQKMQFRIEAINRSAIPVTIKKINFPFGKRDFILNVELTNNQDFTHLDDIEIPENADYSQPYWLQKEGTSGLFDISKQQERGVPENQPVAELTFNLDIAGSTLCYKIPVIYQKTDPILGEVYEPVAITPPVYVSINEKVYLFDKQVDKKVSVVIKAGKDNISGEVKLKIPDGWRASPAAVLFNLKIKGAEQCADFLLFPPKEGSEGEITAEAIFENKTFDKGLGLLSYNHIPTQLYFPRAKAKVVKVNISKTNGLIGYIKGAGDLVPASLQQIGYNVVILEDGDISDEKLQKYDAVVIGVKAYNIVERLKVINQVLLHYVENGGNLIVQYNSDQGLLMQDFGPYPFKVSSKRVTVEGAEVRFLKPDCQALNYPNKITQKDFDGWVQERSLYQPESWSEKYETVISCNDPGSEKLDSGILIAKYGKGNYVYTTMSWFRQLPAGVPGAYRIFSNLISLGR